MADTAWKNDVQRDWDLAALQKHAKGTLLTSDFRSAKKQHDEVLNTVKSVNELVTEFSLELTKVGI